MPIRKITFSELVEHKDFPSVRDRYFAECRREYWGKCSVDMGLYRQMETMGFLTVLGVFDDEHLVGFSIVMLAGEVVTDQDFCNVDCVYVVPELRARYGAALLRRALACGGDAPVTISAATGSHLDRLLAKNRKHFMPSETVYHFRR